MKTKWVLEFYNHADNDILKINLFDIVLNENYIIKQSIDKYGTDEPCIIYRTCLLDDKIFLLREYIQSMHNKGIDLIKKADIPDEVFNGIELIDQYAFLKIIKEEKKKSGQKNLFR